MNTKIIARWVTIGALFIIPFLSLLVTNSLYFPFITGKNFAFRALVEIAFAGWLILAACDARYRPKFSWTLVWYKCLVVWMIIANVLAVNPHKAFWSNYERMDGWVTLGHMYLFFIVLAAVLSTENLWRKWWLTFIAANAITCVHGLLQMGGFAAIHQGSTRIDSSIGNAEYFAGYLMFAIAVTIWQAFETRDKDWAWLKYSLFVLAAIQVILLFATGTRGTLIGLVVAALAGSVFWAVEAGKQGRKAALTVFAALIILVGGLFVFQNSSFVKNSPNIERLASVFTLKKALGPRVAIWHMATEGIKEKPVFGWGQEGFNYVFNKYYEPSLYSQEPWFDRAHNVFLDWAIAGGLPAVFFFIAALVAAFIAIYRSHASRFERVLLLSVLIGYVVQGLVVFDNLFTYIPLIAIFAIAHLASSRPIRLMEKMKEVHGPVLDTAVAPVSVVIGLLLVWFVNIPSVKAGSDLIAAITPSNSPDARLASFKQAVDDHGLAHQEITEQLASFATQEAGDASATQDTRQQIVNYTGDQLNAEIARAPRDARLRLQYALFLRSIGDIKDAQLQSAAARQEAPNKQTVLIEQGVESFLGGQYPAAQDFFVQAYRLDTDDVDLIGYVAGSYIANNNVAGAKALLQKAYGTVNVDHPMVLLAYYTVHDWNDLIGVLQARIANNDNATTEFQLAATYAQAGRKAEAIAQVRAAIAKFPDAAAQGNALLAQLGVTQ